MQTPAHNQIRALHIDVRAQRIVLTGMINAPQYKNQEVSILVENEDSYSFKLSQAAAPNLLYDKQGDKWYLNAAPAGVPVYKFAIGPFLNQTAQTIEGREGVNKLQKTRAEIFRVLVQKIFDFVVKFFEPNIMTIYLWHSTDINEINDIREPVQEIFQIHGHNLQVRQPQHMLSLDLGTGYYLAMVHDIQGKYEMMRSAFSTKAAGGLRVDPNASRKVWSTVYFNPTFDVSTVPRLLRNGDVATVISNTSISEARENGGWIEVQHYKKYLYMVPHEEIVVDKRMMMSNILLTVPLYDKKIDLLHVFLIIMTHIKYAQSEQKLHLDNVRLSVPISAQPIHYTFMRCCAEYVFSESDVDFTTEPEAAFSFLMAVSNEANIFDGMKHAVLMDGGDGTFDYVYVKLFENIWSKQLGHAFNCAGTNIFDKFKQTLLGVFGELTYDLQKLINGWYDEFKKKTAEKKIDDQLRVEYSGFAVPDSCVDALVEEIDRQRVFQITRGKTDLTSAIARTEIAEKGFKKFAQTLRITLTPEAVQKICSPINDFVSNFLNFFGNVQEHMSNKGEQNEPLIIVFVGGLAANKSIAAAVEAEASRLGLRIVCATEPQVAIIKGIPVQRADISLRDFDARADTNLYMLNNRQLKDVNIMTEVCVNYGNQCDFYQPRLSSGQVQFTTQKLLSIGDVLAPGLNRHLMKLTLKMDTPIDFVFYKTRLENVPPFFNLTRPPHETTLKFDQNVPIFRDENLLHRIVVIKSADIDAQTAADLHLSQMLNQRITIEVHLVFEHKRFHPNPILQIYGVPLHDATAKPLLIKEVEVWDWFQKQTVDNAYTFEVRRQE